ncbi:PAS domain-containing protein [Flavobacterium sp.]
MISKNTASDLQFLAGGGEMGRLTREKDWNSNPLGTPDTWPQSLRTTLSILLNSKFPMFLFWGPELICFYNDAYRPSLGNDGKHPKILGGRGEDWWKEIWNDIKPLIDQVLQKGESTWNEDLLLPIYRNGKMEEAYWTFSYSPVNDESGKPAGVFVTCTETTDKVHLIKQLHQSNERFINNITHAPVAMCVFSGENFVVEIVNDLMLKIWEKGRDEVLNKPYFEALPENSNQGYELILRTVYETGEAFSAKESPVIMMRKGKLETIYVDFVCEPLRENDGTISAIIATAIDVTEHKNSLETIEKMATHLKLATDSAKVGTWSLDIETQKLDWSPLHKKLWGYDENRSDLSYEDWHNLILPEDKELAFKRVEESRLTNSFYEVEYRIKKADDGLIRNIRSVGKYYYNDEGNAQTLTGISVDITEQKETEQKVRSVVENAPFAIGVYTGDDMVIELANQAIIDIWGKGNDVIGKKYTDVLPELAGQAVFEQIKEVYATGKSFHTRNTPLDLIVNGKKGTYYFDYDFTPLFDLSGKIYGVMNTGTDVSEINLSKKRIEESDARFRNTVQQAPIGMIILRTKDYIVEMANDAYMQIVNRNPKEFIGRPLFDSIPEAKESTLHLMHHVMDTGESYHGNEVPVPLNQNGSVEIYHFDFVYHPLKEDDGSISGIIVTVSDVTEKVLSRKKIEESEARFRHTVQQAPVAIAIFRGRDYIAEVANNAYMELVDRKQSEFVGRPLFESLPEVKDTIKHLLDSVYDTGIPFHGNEIAAPIKRNGEIRTYYFDLLYAPLKEEDGTISGIIVTATEVTEKVESRKKIERNEERLNIVIEASELGTWEFNFKTQEATYSQRYFEIMSGSKEYKQLSHQELLRYLHPDDFGVREKAFKRAMETGILEYDARLIWDDKSVHWMEGKGKVFFDEEGNPAKMVGTLRDITKERESQLLLVKNEQKFRLLSDSMPQHIWTSDTEGNLNYFNQSVLDYSGYSLREIYEKGWLEIVHPDDREENVAKWTHAISTGNDFLFEHRFRRKDGQYRWQLSRAIPQRNESGEIQMWVGTSTDIEDQKNFANELERQVNERTKELKMLYEILKQSEERYHLMVEEVQDYAILYLSKDGIVENWNKGAEKIKGYKAEEIIGKSFETFYTDDDRENDMPQYFLKQAARYGRYGQEGWRKRKNGTHFWASVVITAVHNSANEVIGYSKVTHDLTSKKEADDKIKLNSEMLSQKNEELEKMNKELQSFAYISSHDLQEPLRKIQTFSDQIVERESQNLSESGKDKFQRMQNAAKRMQTLINDLLAYSRTNTQEVKFKRTNLNTILQEVKDDLAEEFQVKNATIEIEKLGEADIIPFQFHQLMFNLITNALKFTRDAVPPKITIKGEVAKGQNLNERLKPNIEYCHITFSDNGIGFDQQYSEKIFEVFQRLHGKELYQGTGIGLAIVKKIMDNHNGLITATSKPGEGATFDVYIPIKKILD